MREVIVDTVGKGTRTIQVGREERKKRRRSREKLIIRSFVGIICSPRIIPTPGSDYKSFRMYRCWKTTKKGISKPRKPWQRHGETKRRKYGRTRWSGWPSTKTLNELGLCIYPDICC